ncbi:NERD domain-containing protein [Clostridium perfringens]|uniref:nuclease-related domain-containing DEAD/DEAH box helicase n=1 Tax=Clostridium perfringens TaxID=1502 RepID=UPI002247076F|nr:NERD domain-containing protein [Clostridium perfringens]MCX0388275.1 NERD domain-containing protein [Clostridium perfringens]
MDREIIENFNSSDPRTEGEEYLLNKFKTSPRFKGWTIFEQPHINSMKPDFILLHPDKGIIIIEVKDWNLSSETYENGGYIWGENGERIKKNPINQVENYKNSILKMELTNSIEFSEEFHDEFFGCIETVVYFHKATIYQAKKFCEKDNNYTKIWTKNEFDYICNINNKLDAYKYTYALSLNKSKFNRNKVLDKLVKELKCNLQYSDYNYERKQPIKLTYEQEKLAKLQKNSIRRWSGVAGAGKSLSLAQKAVNALKEGHRVLILTYNITLRHYLRDLCSQQFGPGSYSGERKKLRSDLTICHFHDFLKIVMAQFEIEVENDEDNKFTERWINRINSCIKIKGIKSYLKYDYILIDEGQDFESEWIRFLKKFFTEVGEIFIVYDKAQDLYDHGVWIEDSNEIKNIGFKGEPGNLKISMRMPEKMIYLVQDIRNEFNISAEKIIPNVNSQQSLIEITKWINCSPINLTEKLDQIENQVDFLRGNNNSLEDITIITTNEDTGVEIVKRFESRGIKTSHVYDMEKEGNQARRRMEKWKFQGGTGRLKICSYHSYKGWETPNIILVLDSPSTKYEEEVIFKREYKEKNIFDAIFISMSRVKRKALTGEFSFTCLNYLSEYNRIEELFY